MLKLSAFDLLASLSAAAQAVAGRVIDSTSGNGLAGARVEIAPAAAGLIGEASYTAVTDSQGRFHIDNVKDGVYLARYTAPRYLYEGAPAPGRPFQVVAGETAVALEGRMIKMAEASGPVLDGRGDPVLSRVAIDIEVDHVRGIVTGADSTVRCHSNILRSMRSLPAVSSTRGGHFTAISNTSVVSAN